jgi:hypothetical protein
VSERDVGERRQLQRPPGGIVYDTSAEGSGSNTTWAVYNYNNSGDDNAYLASQAMCLGF